MPFTLTATAPKGGKISADGTAGPINETDASLTPLQLTLKNQSVEIAGLAPKSGLSGLVDMTAKLTSDGKQAHIDGNGQVKNFKASNDATPAKQPIGVSYNTNYQYANRQGTLSADATSGKNTAKLSGTYNVGETVVVHLKLSAPGMSIDDLEALLPAFGVTLPSGASLRGGTLTANLTIEGPPDRLVIAGPMSLNNTKLAGFDLGSKMSSLGNLAGIKTGSDTTIQSFSGNFNVTPEVTRVDAVDLVVPALGTVTGAGTIANKNLNFKMVAKVQSTGTGLLGAAGGKAGAQSIPFSIQGTTSNPKFVPDVNGIVQNAIAGQINQRIGAQTPTNVQGALGGLLGGKKKK
jgi:AsmA protein